MKWPIHTKQGVDKDVIYLGLLNVVLVFLISFVMHLS